MVWLGIDATGNSLLLRCDQRQHASSYQHTILSTALPFIRGRGSQRATPRQRIFQQDGASSHTAASTKAWLTNHQVNCMENWPAQSPDLNLVENCWAAMAKAMTDRRFHNTEALWQGVRHVWQDMPRVTRIRQLYNSMGRRLAAVIVTQGGHKKY